MSTSTNMVSGLSSGFDWQTMITQLIAIDHRRVDLIEDQKTEYADKLSEWQSINTMLLSLKTAADALNDPDDFYLYSTEMSTDSTTVDAEDLLTVSADTTASLGSYTIKVTNLATAQKLSSNPFTSKTSELGSAYEGEILINGQVIAIDDTDTLADVADSINNANSGTDPIGVSASIVSYGANDYRLILTSDSTGEDGISLLNGSSTNLVQKFGWKDKQAAVIKNSITQGAQSDRFSSSTTAIKSLLGLSTGEATTTPISQLTIDGTPVDINLSEDSLTDIKEAINEAMAAVPRSDIVASVVSETVDGTTYYRLQIEGTQTFVDEKNILNTLGILHNNSADISAANSEISANSMTSDGAYITPDTLLVDIDGYISYTAGDKITFGGGKTGGAVVAYDFSISTSTTVEDLLNAIETQYSTTTGDAVAYLTSDGKIRVDDMAAGGSLNVILATAGNIASGELVFVDGDGAFGDATEARKRQIVAGGDATVEIDGVEVSNSSNVIEDVIAGVTLNLVNEDNTTTVTLNIEHDTAAIKSKILDFVNYYNEIASYINTQFSYDEDSETTGGILFGDGTLTSIKTDLLSIITDSIWGVVDEYNALSLIGITMEMDDDNKMTLSVDESTLDGYLETNFNDVKSLFVGQGTVVGSSLTYINHTRDTEKGAYEVHINRAATRGTTTGNVNLTGGGADDTLTITQGSKTASISITSDMTLDDIKNAINTELDAEYRETIVGDQQLYADATQTNEITAETTWNSVYNSSGTSAGLQDNDVILFTGTDRTGGTVSGSYIVSTTDTVQDLLSAIEDAFSSNVAATIDTSGRIVITEKSAGESQISLSITEPATRQLNFGTVDVTDGAGDGSVEGRYALSITATDDGSGNLVLRNDEYGDSSFTISQNPLDSNYNYIKYTTTSNTTDSTSGTVYIASSTTWDDIYGADVANNDTIIISGTDRDGNALTPTTYSLTYQISDITTDTVGDLLTRIENVFGDAGNTTPTTVDAFIQDGKIYVEQTGTTGSSLITLNLTASNEGGGSLSLGDFNQNTQRDLDLGLINGTATGQDVAGTIGGEPATGTGRVLSGDDGNVNTDGLSIEYTGTSNDVKAGTITLTLGIAELFERALYSITDPIDGYLSYKQDSLEDSINRFDEKIEEMEARLDQKTQMMIARYVAMEMALNAIQNQTQWLTGQINSLGNWGL